MIAYYTGTLEEMQILDAQITSNCNWPEGGTANWDNPRETAISGVYAILAPTGSHGFTKEQMASGILNSEVNDVEFPQVLE